MESLKFNNFFVKNVFNGNKIATTRKDNIETKFLKNGYFIATLKNGFEFAICKIKVSKSFHLYEFDEETESVVYHCKKRTIILHKNNLGFKTFKELKEFYNNYFKQEKTGSVIIFDIKLRLHSLEILNLKMQEIINLEKLENEGVKNV